MMVEPNSKKLPMMAGSSCENAFSFVEKITKLTCKITSSNCHLVKQRDGCFFFLIIFLAKRL